MKIVEELHKTANWYRPQGDKFPGVHELLDDAAREIERLRDCLKWLLENDELTNYGQKTAREALDLKE